MSDQSLAFRSQPAAEDIRDPDELRKLLCQDEKGHRATALSCQICTMPCGYGMRLLELLEIPYKGVREERGSMLEMLRTGPALDRKGRMYGKGIIHRRSGKGGGT